MIGSVSSFLLPFAKSIIEKAIAKIPDDAELGDKLIDICLVIIGKAVKMTKTEIAITKGGASWPQIDQKCLNNLQSFLSFISFISFISFYLLYLFNHG